jgi:hypothetical protein
MVDRCRGHSVGELLSIDTAARLLVEGANVDLGKKGRRGRTGVDENRDYALSSKLSAARRGPSAYLIGSEAVPLSRERSGFRGCTDDIPVFFINLIL